MSEEVIWGKAASLSRMKPGDIALVPNQEAKHSSLVFCLSAAVAHSGLDRGAPVFLCQADANGGSCFRFHTQDQMRGGFGWLLPSSIRLVPAADSIQGSFIDLHRHRSTSLFLDENGGLQLAGYGPMSGHGFFSSWAELDRAVAFENTDTHRQSWISFSRWTVEMGCLDRPTLVWTNSAC